MKKRFLPIFIAGFLSCLTLASCHSVNLYEYTENESYANHYLVSFYVDDTLYTTAQVKEGETISVTISDPSKENYSFDGWVLEDGTAFDVSTAVITSNIDVYASFSLINTGGTNPWDELVVTDTKDPNKTYSLVIGWYGKTSTSGIDENIMKHWYYNALVYLRHIGLTEEQLNGVTVRQYGDADTNIGPLGELVNAHADVDILLGTGKNLTTQGKIETVERIDGVTINGTTGRTLALLKESEIGRSLFDFLNTEPGSKMFDMSFILSDSDLGTI